MKGVVITTNREMYVLDIPESEPLYRSTRPVLDGPMEIVHPRGLPRPYCMIVNEEGLMHDLPLNEVGSVWYGTHIHGQPIVGNIIIMKEGFRDGEWDLIGLNGRDIGLIKNSVIQLFGGIVREITPPEPQLEM